MLIMKIIRMFKLCFICIRHGINPFSKIGPNQEKLKERLTDSEKEWLINVLIGYAKTYIKQIFCDS